MQKITTTKLLTVAVASAMLSGQTVAADSNDSSYKLNTKTRLVYFDREYENTANDRTQSALAITADWSTPQYGGWFGVGISPYFVQEIDSDGKITEDVLTVKDGEAQGYALIGQAFVNLTPFEGFSAKIGRQTHKSMFLSSSGSRAVPNSFQGISAKFIPVKGLNLYGAVYNKWSPRANNDFIGFKTDQSSEGDLNYVSLMGLQYKKDAFAVDAEYLNAKDYIGKLGLRGSYVTKFEDSSLKFTAGVFSSFDNGDLFVTSSEKGELDDEDVAGSVDGVSKSSNDGLGAFLEAKWSKGNTQLTAAVSKTDDIWIEDNFAGDHGTNPFPTRSSVGPDLTNANETVLKLEVKYDWKDYAPGLVTSIAAAKGWDAENSANPSLGSADEEWRELVVSYKVPAIKGLKFTGVIHDYNSDKVGRVDGVKDDETDVRLYLDYTYAFNL
ncbi:MAG: OprD family porin [Oceanospirillales bacterium]|nr:OprD family porin [Oceanospirillales bacterium]MBR9888709.1 OprD family porin [Oceanospirillales bacterium]